MPSPPSRPRRMWERRHLAHPPLAYRWGRRMTIGYLGTLMVGCMGLGWWAGRRAPEGIEWKLWVKAKRKLGRRFRAF